MHIKWDSLNLIKRDSFAVVFIIFVISSYLSTTYIERFIEPLMLARAKFVDYIFKARLFYIEKYNPGYLKESAVVLIALDDDSILRTKRNINTDPDLAARAIENISASGPKVIVLDIAFLHNALDPTPPQERAKLVAAIRKAGNVITSYYLGDMGLLKMDEEILKASMGYGRSDTIASRGDDIVRVMIPPGFEHEWQIKKIPVPIKAALVYRDIPSYQFMLDKPRRKIYFPSKHDTLTVPVTEFDKVPINYLYSGNHIPTISFWKFLLEGFRSDALHGKIALISSTSKMSYDWHYTPIGRIPGALILANLINSFVHSYLLVEVGAWTYTAILMLAGGFLAFLFYKNKILTATIILILAVIISPVASFILLLHNIIWNGFDMITLAVILYVSVLIHKVCIWEAEKKSS